MLKNLHDLYRTRIARDGYTDDPAQHAVLDGLQDLLAALKKKSLLGPRQGGGVYIHGPVGRGKTMLMDLFFDAVPDGVAKRRVHFHAFMIAVHDSLHRARRAEKKQNGPDRALTDFAKNLARDVRVLCFDEFHVVDVADAMILSRLFTALLDHGIIVVMTSNWPPEKLYEGGLQRDRFLPFIALLQARFRVMALDGGTDYRLRLLEDNGVWRYPLGAAAQDWADALFRELSDSAPLEPVALPLRGRTLRVERCTRGIARFTFAELCERPTGAEDYLAIADAFHTVFLEGVPKLRYDRRNEAKRLMVLVDALYDSGTRLIVTADAPPEKLYYGHDHAFEFERTVSRLIEMQSHDWLMRAKI